MGDKDIQVYEGGGVPEGADVPLIADDSVIEVARKAVQRVEAVKQIKGAALAVTNENDWVDQNGKPYLVVSGSEKIANLFDISWPGYTTEKREEPEGHYTYIKKGVFYMGKRQVAAEGSRTSLDGFFKQNLYEGKGNQRKLVREKHVHERDNERDVEMSAYTNFLGNGITRMLGLRNLTYKDLEHFAGIKKENLGKVVYKSGDESLMDSVQPIQEPQAKKPATAPQKATTAATAPPEGEDKLPPRDQLDRELLIYVGLGPQDYEEVLKEISTYQPKTGANAGRDVWLNNLNGTISDQRAKICLSNLRKLTDNGKNVLYPMPEGCTESPNDCGKSASNQGIAVCEKAGMLCPYWIGKEF